MTERAQALEAATAQFVEAYQFALQAPADGNERPGILKMKAAYKAAQAALAVPPPPPVGIPTTECRCDCVNCVTGNCHQCYYETPHPPVEPAGATQPEKIRRFAVYICDDCLNLRGEMCHEPNCRFCRCTMAEVADYLDVLLIRPIIDGIGVIVDHGEPL